MLLHGPLLHVPVPILLRRCPWNLLVLSDKGRLELFNLLIILDDFALDFWYHLLLGLRNILLLWVVRRIVDRSWLTTIERRPGNLGTTLHFRGQVPVFQLLELLLNILLLFICDRATFIVVVDVLLS